ncbi:MAG: phosphoribosyltransferase family protein [Candidatus Spechtbacterales bacterium]|nr:phosphoribosyltransferase family protein [Candidatus Spechtbacterales bacterium]
MYKELNTIKNMVTESLFPSFCYKCKKTGTYLCNECLWQLKALYEPTCPHCDLRLPFGKLPPKCKSELKLNRIFTCGLYSDNALGDMIRDMKYKYARALASPLSTFALWQLEQGAYLNTIKENADVIIPVPMHKRKLKKRGFNQAELIARHLSDIINVPVKTETLIKTNRTIPQVKTDSRKERLQNLEGVFEVSNDSVKNKTILLVDDVITTGSTMRQCAIALNSAGTKEVWGLAVLKD